MYSFAYDAILSSRILAWQTVQVDEEEHESDLSTSGNLSIVDIPTEDEESDNINLHYCTSPEEQLGNQATDKYDIWYSPKLLET